jgi:ABC-type sugar transport system permease subunit
MRLLPAAVRALARNQVETVSMKRRGEQMLGLLMAGPALLVVLGIYLYPAVFTLVLSFADYDLVRLSIKRFVGFANFSSLAGNPAFVQATLRTIYFGLLVSAVTTVLAFLIALLLDQKFYGRGLLRVFVVLPWAVPPVVAGVLWGQMFHADVGFVNAMLFQLGLIDSYRIWLGDAWTALHVIAIAEIWKAIPFMVLFFLAGLQSLPQQVFEAAAVDGATATERFRYILVPLMTPVAIPLMLIQFVWSMKAFDTIFVLTRGGPAGGTTTLNYFVYQEAFQSFNLGRASAAAYILLLVTLLTVAVFAFIRIYVDRKWRRA